MYETSDKRRDEALDARAFGLGVVMGAVLGAGAALLLAPASGAQTRRKIRRGARRLYSQGGEVVGELWEGADRSTRNLRKSATRGLKGSLRRSREYADDALELVGSGRKRFGWR